MQRLSSLTLAPLALAATLALGACGSDSDDEDDIVPSNDADGLVTDGSADGVPDPGGDVPTDASPDVDSDVPEDDLPGTGTGGPADGLPDTGAPTDGDDPFETRIRTDIEEFLGTVDGLAAAPVARPDEIVFETTETLIAYGRFDDTGESFVLIPRWGDLGEEERGLFEEWAATSGGAFDGERLFDELFGWFFVVHELGHHLQAESGIESTSPWDEELQANEIAVAYLASTDRARLDALVPVMRGIRDSLEPPEGAGDRDYFDREYEEIEGPTIYGYFQFDFVDDAYERVDELDLATIVRDDLGL